MTVLRTALLLGTFAFAIAPLQAEAPRCDSGTTPTALKDLRVVKQCTDSAPDSSGQPTTKTYGTTQRAELGDHVVVMVSGLARFRAEANAQVDWSRIMLVIDGQPLKGVTPLYTDLAHSHLEFVLKQDSTNHASWIPVLSGAVRHRAVTLSVGFDGQPPLQSDVDEFRLVAIPSVWVWVWIAITACTAIVLVWTARCSNLLRDVGQNPVDANGVMHFKPYSLARTQMAVWFFVVLTAYLFIWLVTGTLDSLTSSVLALAGISAATAVAGTTIDTKNQASAPAAAPTAPRSESFFTDILSDSQGYSLARVQIAVWTFVLVVVFVRSVWKDLAMPEFDATLLGLMGISNGTYVGFKGLEQ